jgi:hypothetical protein
MPEAQVIVSDWETGTLGRLLMTQASSDLMMRIARALQAAYARGLTEA